MTPSRFSTLLNIWYEQSQKTLDSKADEYAPGDERFHNFIIAAQILQHIGVIDTPAKAAFAMQVKHLVSIMDLLAGRVPLTIEIINEKFGDNTNYDYMIRGMLVEELERNTNSQLIP